MRGVGKLVRDRGGGRLVRGLVGGGCSFFGDGVRERASEDTMDPGG